MSFSLPEIVLHKQEQLYLLLDGGQIAQLERRLFEIADTPVYQPLYLYAPWESLREVSPCLVVATEPLLRWYAAEFQPNSGYLLASTLALLPFAERLRGWIEAQSPYGSRILLKPAQPEGMYRLFQDDDPRFWQDITQVWIPVREQLQPRSKLIWWHKTANLPTAAATKLPPQRENAPLRLSDAQWQRLGEVSWLNSLDTLYRHMEKWFPSRLAEQETPNQWITDWATWGYKQGFTSLRDLMFFSNVIGYIGTVWLDDGHCPDIVDLLMNASVLTPSQRIEKAAQLAEIQNKIGIEQ
ncbi:DUF4123 domain-containing protein [Plesiomonas shigelloides]|uniref:DUF4123 domain-containing protein n=1 Tax=Plesiomonas shigelloides TaxID=703 RepID=UPI0012626A60|nr:DUF4123 domain-containing protein [Plesiomonas shigelloides]KAB7695428.1 DUF4123 domain-containing protein [Plesiomonas shigelloides]